MGTVVHLPSPRRRRAPVLSKEQATIHLFLGVRYVRDTEADLAPTHAIIPDPRHLEAPLELA